MIALLIAFLSFSAQAKNTIPTDDKVMIHFGFCTADYLPSQFQILVWNIEKAQAKNDWEEDFSKFAKKSDVVLLQESMMDDFVPAAALRQPGYCWNFATSFINDDQHATGVMSGSLIQPLSVHFLRSPGREPILKTPKMVLIEEYALAMTRETLLIANIHGLNFVSNKHNRAQIQQAANFMKQHTGPIIFAGDFNSWNQDRLDSLDAILGKLGMKKVEFKDDPRSLKLDHVYVRGLRVVQNTLHFEIRSSDHKPISAEFQLQ